jgi:hypothetical protein
MELPAGVKRTSGGTYDPDAGLLYFIASNPTAVEATPHPNLLVAVNELETAKNLDTFDRMLDSGRRVFLDSGIFNLANAHARAHGVSHDVGLSMAPELIDGFDRLWDRYGTIVTKYADRLWGAVELDQGGVVNKRRIRARIEQEFGIVPMPVYHPLLDGWDYYDELAQGYDRICFGNIVKASPPLRLRLTHTASERARAYPYLWQHFLGLTPNENLIALPYRGSCDSSSWLTLCRWQPSWRAFAMQRSVSDYPSEMWPVGSVENESRRGLGHELAALLAYSSQRTLDALKEDTHAWL